MLYVVYDNDVIVFESDTRSEALVYAQDRSRIVGSDVFLSEYEHAYTELIVADDD